ncbi:MAG TPA: PilX N-terminal domain-containing pilus assembly protein [Steroidobacteraceae bacterium]|jgi:type IV pilus assembly protein PilX|nr:PilX N-terminal domain-containing pilus assembly protein [Steroidobacteraceae bacterium]
MQKQSFSLGHRSKQSGVVLFVALILLLILSLLGVTAARMQTVEERMARNDDNRQIGQQAAEAALRSAENGLLTGIYVNFAGNTNGLYAPILPNGSPLTGMDWTNPANTLPYGGPAMTSMPANAAAPKVVIENLPSVAVAGDDLSVTSLNPASPPVTVYRVTAQGIGADGSSTTMLQTIVR